MERVTGSDLLGAGGGAGQVHPVAVDLVGNDEESEQLHGDRTETLASDTGTLTAAGEFTRAVPTPRNAGWPFQLPPFEGDVEDVSRQHIANRAASSSIRHRGTSASGGCRTSSDQRDGVRTGIVAVGLDGGAVAPRVKVTSP